MNFSTSTFAAVLAAIAVTAQSYGDDSAATDTLSSSPSNSSAFSGTTSTASDVLRVSASRSTVLAIASDSISIALNSTDVVVSSSAGNSNEVISATASAAAISSSSLSNGSSSSNGFLAAQPVHLAWTAGSALAIFGIFGASILL